jgi:hypothetical protein
MGIVTRKLLPIVAVAALTLCVPAAMAVPLTAAETTPPSDQGPSQTGADQEQSQPGTGTATPSGEPATEAAADTVTPPGQAKSKPDAGTTTPPGQSRKGSRPGAKTGADAPGTGPAARPVLGRSMAVKPVSGAVKVRVPRGDRYVALGEAGSIPPGSVLDARHGRVELETAVSGGRTQTATFWGAIFEVRQARAGRGMTDIVVRGGRPAGCRARAAARGRVASLALESGRPGAKAPTTGLWAKDRNGRYRTRGRNSVATVRGTRWLTKETCAGTLTRVTEGVVGVRDGRRHKTVVVRAGHSHLARDAR